MRLLRFRRGHRLDRADPRKDWRHMPRYYFHTMDGQVIIDDEGTELPDADAARLEALKTAGSILASGEANGMLAETPWNMSVVDESSRTVFTLAFQARKYF
jgi:hypothetical protein